MKLKSLASLILVLLVTLSMSTYSFAEGEEDVLEDAVAIKSSYLQLKPTITTNYISQGVKYVRADVAVRVERKIMSNVAAHKDPIRDIIIMLLARQEKETLTSSDGISSLREEAKEEIIAFLESEGEPTEVLDVLFMSFLVE